MNMTQLKEILKFKPRIERDNLFGRSVLNEIFSPLTDVKEIQREEKKSINEVIDGIQNVNNYISLSIKEIVLELEKHYVNLETNLTVEEKLIEDLIGKCAEAKNYMAYQNTIIECAQYSFDSGKFVPLLKLCEKYIDIIYEIFDEVRSTFIKYFNDESSPYLLSYAVEALEFFIYMGNEFKYKISSLVRFILA